MPDDYSGEANPDVSTRTWNDKSRCVKIGLFFNYIQLNNCIWNAIIVVYRQNKT
jgi:hypothetical protein